MNKPNPEVLPWMREAAKKSRIACFKIFGCDTTDEEIKEKIERRITAIIAAHIHKEHPHVSAQDLRIELIKPPVGNYAVLYKRIATLLHKAEARKNKND